jgi:hypothetical protein
MKRRISNKILLEFMCIRRRLMKEHQCYGLEEITYQLNVEKYEKIIFLQNPQKWTTK